MPRIFNLIVSILLVSWSSWSQVSDHFNGTLVYHIERVDIKDSSTSKMMIFARDSLIKIVNFSPDLGRQETIKHLVYQKKYVLIELAEGKFAIQMKDSLHPVNKACEFKATRGHVKIAGIRGKKLSADYELVKNDLTVVYTKKISSKYLDAFTNAPGLLLMYYVANDHGLFKYTLESIDYKTPPIALFLIPSDFQKVSMDEFLRKSTITKERNVKNN
ncbi:MAG: hypothetical protein ACO29U_06085 [Crocinitomicaceae bacterium]